MLFRIKFLSLLLGLLITITLIPTNPSKETLGQYESAVKLVSVLISNISSLSNTHSELKQFTGLHSVVTNSSGNISGEFNIDTRNGDY